MRGSGLWPVWCEYPSRLELLNCQSGRWKGQSSGAFQCYELTFAPADGGGTVKALGDISGNTFTGIIATSGYWGSSSAVLGNLFGGTRLQRCYASVSCVKTQMSYTYGSGDSVFNAEVRLLPIQSATSISCINGTY